MHAATSAAKDTCEACNTASGHLYSDTGITRAAGGVQRSGILGGGGGLLGGTGVNGDSLRFCGGGTRDTWWYAWIGRPSLKRSGDYLQVALLNPGEKRLGVPSNCCPDTSGGTEHWIVWAPA